VFFLKTGETERTEESEPVLMLMKEEIDRIKRIRGSRVKQAVVLLVIGWTSIFVVFIMIFYEGIKFSTTDMTNWFILVMIVFSLALIKTGSDILRSAKELMKLGGGRYFLKEKLKCTNEGCDYNTLREWKEGDFIGMIVDEKCPKCSSKLQIVWIYGKPEKKIKRIPILPGLGV